MKDEKGRLHETRGREIRGERVFSSFKLISVLLKFGIDSNILYVSVTVNYGHVKRRTSLLEHKQNFPSFFCVSLLIVVLKQSIDFFKCYIQQTAQEMNGIVVTSEMVTLNQSQVFQSFSQSAHHYNYWPSLENLKLRLRVAFP
jgi:hypothetical protein